MAKTGIFSWFSYSLPMEDRLRLIKNAGFDATSLWWGEEDKQLHPDLTRKLGLHIDNIHVPFIHPNDLWLDNLDGEGYLNLLLNSVGDCARHAIPVAVVHITGFSEVGEVSALGIERVKKLVDFAEQKDVRLAFENLLYVQHLDFIFEHIKSDHLGLCYDSGHENCSPQHTDCLQKYGDRLFAVHLHDNFGDADTHMLPYDGTVDWPHVKEKLAACRKVDCVTLEVNFDPQHEKSQIYSGLSPEDYLTLAYQRAVRLL